MINAYSLHHGALIGENINHLSTQNIAWVDLFAPTHDEDILVEKLCKVDVPTREEMSEIEPSNRLYVENNVAYMTASVMCNTQVGEPKLASTTFILTKSSFISVRYDKPKSFEIFLNRANKPRFLESRHDAVYGSLIDTIIDRTADILEKASAEMDEASSIVFTEKKAQAQIYHKVMRSLGKKGELVSKIRESLMSLTRMLHFATSLHEGIQLTEEGKSLAKTQLRDCEYLAQHCDSLSNKITFLMDATLGLVSLEQNAIIKIFSVASVALMPPTLVASIYGMNFKSLPELNWEYGYPYAIGLMAVSALLPYLFFKWKKWL